MNFMKMDAVKSNHEELTIGLPASRDTKIIAHIWTTDKDSTKDIRFDFYGKAPSLEVEMVSKLLISYGTELNVNPLNFHTKSYVPTLLVPLLQKKMEGLGLNIRWITIHV